jgi:hypothetical protein
MKMLTTALLALTLVLGAVSTAFAGTDVGKDTTKKHHAKKSKAKKTTASKS